VATIAIVVGSAQLLPPPGPSGTEIVVGPHPLDGKAAPDFTLQQVGPGDAVTLSALRGRPVVVNFWAPSCLPCRAEFPVLRSALAAHAGSGLVLLGVWFHGGNFLDSADDVTSFMAEQSADWPALADPGSLVQDAWDVVVPPTTFFVDRTGVVRAVQLGEMNADLFERQLAKIL
jgi:cytochrome c biogenesis protein CcmG/thiol:disulfide interchange protein DsbE